MTNEFDFIDHPLVALWLKELAKKEPLAVCFLLEGKKQDFQKKYGKSLGQSQGFDYWKCDHLGITMYLYSSNENTVYRVQYLGEKKDFQSDKKMGSYLTSFLSKILKEIELV